MTLQEFAFFIEEFKIDILTVRRWDIACLQVGLEPDRFSRVVGRLIKMQVQLFLRVLRFQLLQNGIDTLCAQGGNRKTPQQQEEWLQEIN